MIQSFYELGFYELNRHPTALTRSDYIKFNEQLFPRGGLAIPVITETTINNQSQVIREIAANISSEEISDEEEPFAKKKTIIKQKSAITVRKSSRNK